MVLVQHGRASLGIAAAFFGFLAGVSKGSVPRSVNAQPGCLLQAGISASKKSLTYSDSQGANKKSSALPTAAVRETERAFSRSHRDSITLLAETSQWRGDVFADAFPRDDTDMGFAIFNKNLKAEWAILCLTVVVLCLFDFVVLQHLATGKTGNHAAQLAFWLSCGVAYNMIVLARQGRERAVEWCSGYFLEWILSMDNLFVFHLIFSTYATPKELLHKALFLGIIGAVAFRMCFFMALASLLHMIHWARIIFGIILIISGIQAAREDDDDVDVSDLVVVRWLKGCLGSRLVEKYDLEGHRMIITEDGQFRATLLVPVVVCLEATDILFAVDSVTAKVAQIPDYYIAYSSSVLAMFGLRAMFFIMDQLVDMFELLKYGLCFILVWIGIQLLLEDYVKLPAQVVCVVILSIFLVCTVGSAARSFYKQDRNDGGSTTPSTSVSTDDRSINGSVMKDDRRINDAITKIGR